MGERFERGAGKKENRERLYKLFSSGAYSYIIRKCNQTITGLNRIQGSQISGTNKTGFRNFAFILRVVIWSIASIRVLGLKFLGW